jgi:WD40 repeat protein
MKNDEKTEKERDCMLDKYKKGLFLSNPNLKYKKLIVNNNYSNGLNDIFEIFTSFENKETYIASPSKFEYLLDIISIKTCKSFITLKGHKNYINKVKYFMNDNNNNEYLISVDKDNVIIIWDITNKYSNIYKIDNNISRGSISDVLLIFNIVDSKKIINDYIIISYNTKIFTSVYSLNKKCKIKTIEKTNEYNTYYLIQWYNRKDSNNYIIELSDGNIFIYNIKDNTLYTELTSGYFDYLQNNCGYIYNNNNNDFLVVSSPCGNINIWDLEIKDLYCNISLYDNFDNKKLYISYILQWSSKYMIVCEYVNKGFKIIDIDTLKIITSVNGVHTGGIICAKKFHHPIYGESLLSLGQDNNIILWSVV